VNSFSITDLPLAGLKRIDRGFRSDSRGFLTRIFCVTELAKAGWHEEIVQINHTCTHKQGTVRGMHFQYPPETEMKLVSCIRGEVWDVALDIRTGSPTFLQWHAERLSANNGHALLIPEGFAHGFQTLSDDVELLYCHSRAYATDAEGGLNPRDTRLGITWPLAITEISARDTGHPLIEIGFEGVQI